MTVALDGGHLSDPTKFAAGARQAASGRGASITSVHTTEEIISMVTVVTAGRSEAVAVVSEALRRPTSSPSR